MAGKGSPSPPSTRSNYPGKRPPALNVSPAGGMVPAGNWQPLSPRSADRLLGGKNGAGETGNFGGGPMSPGGTPFYPGLDKRDSRRTILLNLTYLNLFLALILLILGAAGPAYPGHSGTTNNAYTDGNNRRLTTQDSPLYQTNCPTSEVDSANASILHSALIIGLVIWFTQPFFARRIYKQVDKRGASETLLTSVVGAFTCLGAFAVVMVDINYIAGCCSLLEDNCEVSNLCTQFVDDCCISEDVEEYCDNPSYHVGAVSMIFLVFISNSAMMIMACTMTCRCWLDSDPEKQAMMMIITGSPMAQSQSPASPMFSPRANVLAGEGASSPVGRTVTSRPGNSRGRGPSGATAAGGAGGGGGKGGGGGREKCPQCGAMFGNAVTLVNHVERFHPKGQGRTLVSSSGETIELPAGVGKRALARKGSNYMPDEMPNIISYSQVKGLK